MNQRKHRIALIAARESSFGVTPTITPGDGQVVLFDTETFDASRAFLPSAQANSGDAAYARRPGVGILDKQNAGAELGVSFDPKNHGLLLRAMLGGYAVTGAGDFDHVFTPGDLPSYTWEKQFLDLGKYVVFNGMKVASWSIAIGPSGYLGLKLNWLGAGMADTSPASASIDAAPTSNFIKPFSLAKANMTIKRNGSAIATVTALNIDGDNELDGDLYTVANQGKRGALSEGMGLIKGKLTALFDSTTLLEEARAETTSAIEVSIQHGTGDGTSGNEKLVIELGGVHFDVAIPRAQGKAGVLYDLTFNAVGGAAAHPITATLNNAIATY